MRNSRLCTQALSPNERALLFCKLRRPRGFKAVIVNHHDFARWWFDFPEEILVVGRWYGPRDGDVDRFPWDALHAQRLADEQAECRDAGNSRIDVWECINMPVPHSSDDMKRLNAFEYQWVEIMHSRGMKTVVGIFPRGNPPEEGIEWMEHFRPAIEASDYFGYHGYGKMPHILDGKEDLIFRHRRLLEAAGLPNHPTMLTEFGLDMGSAGHGYKTYLSDTAYVNQLKDSDRELRDTDDPAKYAFIFCHGTFGGWPTFDLTDAAATMLGQYIVGEGDVPEAGLVLTAHYRFEPSPNWRVIGDMSPADDEYCLPWQIPQEGSVQWRFTLLVDGKKEAELETPSFEVEWESGGYAIELLSPIEGATITTRTVELRVRVRQGSGGSKSLLGWFRSFQIRDRVQRGLK